MSSNFFDIGDKMRLERELALTDQKERIPVINGEDEPITEDIVEEQVEPEDGHIVKGITEDEEDEICEVLDGLADEAFDCMADRIIEAIKSRAKPKKDK